MCSNVSIPQIDARPRLVGRTHKRVPTVVIMCRYAMLLIADVGVKVNGERVQRGVVRTWRGTGTGCNMYKRRARVYGCESAGKSFLMRFRGQREHVRINVLFNSSRQIHTLRKQISQCHLLIMTEISLKAHPTNL
jgi:hypothetical protein